MTVTKPSTIFRREFDFRVRELREDSRAAEQKRNETGNLWKKSLKEALEAAGFTVKLEMAHDIKIEGEYFDKMKSDLTVLWEGCVIAVIESKDYFSIDYIRRAAFELSTIANSYDTPVMGIVFAGRLCAGEDRVDRWMEKFNLTLVKMCDERRVGSRTVVNSDFDINYNKIDELVATLAQAVFG